MAKEYQKKIDVVNTVATLISPNFLDTFDIAIAGWTLAGTGTDYIAANDAAAAYRGARGLKLQTRATTPAIGDTVSVTKEIGKIQSKYISVKIMMNQISPDVQIRIWDVSKTGNIQWSIFYDDSEKTISVETSLDVFTVKYTHPNVFSRWQQIGLTVDAITNKYKEIIFGSQLIDISDLSGFNLNNTPVNETITAQIKIIANAAASQSSYFDDFLCIQE